MRCRLISRCGGRIGVAAGAGRPSSGSRSHSAISSGSGATGLDASYAGSLHEGESLNSAKWSTVGGGNRPGSARSARSGVGEGGLEAELDAEIRRQEELYAGGDGLSPRDATEDGRPNLARAFDSGGGGDVNRYQLGPGDDEYYQDQQHDDNEELPDTYDAEAWLVDALARDAARVMRQDAGTTTSSQEPEPYEDGAGYGSGPDDYYDCVGDDGGDAMGYMEDDDGDWQDHGEFHTADDRYLGDDAMYADEAVSDDATAEDRAAARRMIARARGDVLSQPHHQWAQSDGGAKDTTEDFKEDGDTELRVIRARLRRARQSGY